MISLLARIFIKDYQDVGDPRVRRAYGVLCSCVGIFLNVLLFLGKFLAGMWSGSIAIMADAFNNLSDAGSSFVTLLGFKLAAAKPDSGHPFGHGRMEYVSGFIVSVVILIMAYELVRSSVGKVMHPTTVEYTDLALGILVASIFVKLYMCLYNWRMGKRLNSAAMRATATDSLSDAIATLVVFVAALVGRHTGLMIDGYCGVLVGLFVFYAGIQAARDTINPLLGQAPDPDFVASVREIALSCPAVYGIHDLIVHDYGPGRRMLSLHAEVAADGNLLELHEAIDAVEDRLREELHCDAVIHMDPVVTSDTHVLRLKEQLTGLLAQIGNEVSMHDFRVIFRPEHTKLIFDVAVPYEFPMDDEALAEEIRGKVREQFGESYECVIQLDRTSLG